MEFGFHSNETDSRQCYLVTAMEKTEEMFMQATIYIYTVSQKKQATIILSITSPNVDRFSFFSLTDSLVNMQQNCH